MLPQGLEGVNLDAVDDEGGQPLRLGFGKMKVITGAGHLAGYADGDAAGHGVECRVALAKSAERICSGKLCHDFYTPVRIMPGSRVVSRGASAQAPPPD